MSEPISDFPIATLDVAAPGAQADALAELLRGALKLDALGTIEATSVVAIGVGGLGLVPVEDFAGGGAGIESVDELPETGNFEGRIIYLTSDQELHIFRDGEWERLIPDVTVTLPEGMAGIETVDALPETGNFEGRIVYLTSDQELYRYSDGAWVRLIPDVTVTLPDGVVGIETVDALPETGNFEGRIVFLTTDQELYRYSDGAWVRLIPDVTVTLPDGVVGIESVDELPTEGNFVGRMVFLTTEERIYIYKASGWAPLVDASTVTFPEGFTGIEIVAALPGSDNFEGRIVYLTTEGKLYKFASGAWRPLVDTTDVTFPDGFTGIEIVAALPGSDNFEGRIVYLTTDNKLYRHTGSAWTAAIAAADISGTITATQITDGAISTPKLAANAVTTSKISAGAVTASEIAANAVTADKILAGAVVAGKIAANAVTATEIAAGSIVAAKIAANAVTADKILAGAITAAKIDSGAVTTEHLAAGAVTALTIAANAVTASAIAANAVTADKITAGAITAAKIDTGAVTAGKIAALAVTAGTIAAGAVNAAAIAANAVTSDKITAGAITAAKIDTGAVTAGKIAALAVTAGTIAAGAVTATEIAANAITADKIMAGAITAAKIDVGAITADKIAAGAITTAKLAAQSVTANEIAVNAITASKIQAGAISASHLAASAVTADKIAAGAVTAAKLSVASLAAVSATLGAVDISSAIIGSLQVDTLNLAGNAVTVQTGTETAGGVSVNASGFTQIQSVTASWGSSASVWVFCQFRANSGDEMTLEIRSNGVALANKTFSPKADAFSHYIDMFPSGAVSGAALTLWLKRNTSGTTTVQARKLAVFAAKR